MNHDLPCGIHVRVTARGDTLVIVERETGEPLQYITRAGDMDALLAQWDATIGAPVRKKQR